RITHRTRSWSVDRTFRTHHQSDDVLDLLHRQDAIGTEAWHQRARESRVRVVNLLIGCLRVGLGKSPNFAVIDKAWANCAVAHLFFRELVTGVAIAAVLSCRRIVRKAKTIAALRDLLAPLPVANQFAVGRILDPRAFACGGGARHLSWWSIPIS